ncbi:MAG: type I-C CRISPR-associated protein Cas8c/Csd1 [Oscillospiraceae bacterium]|nr:type I-C CRISPR-associated protein Cas8c/Csd1 [Oscillospiraceae bacterium]
MSWTNELYQVYEKQCGRETHDGTVLLPVSHSTANAQIEVTLKADGTFVGAVQLTKEEGLTIIPVSAASGKRSGRFPPPHPFADKLFYLAGDLEKYLKTDKYKKFYDAYISQLKEWYESQYVHDAVSTLYVYLTKQTLISDLIDCHVIEFNDEKMDEKKIESFVRFRVNYSDFSRESRTWVDETLSSRYIEYALSKQANSQVGLCYALGKKLPIMENTEHSKQIIPRCANAKLICLNDQKLAYLGRFDDDKQAISVSYDFSQKMHNALRWLIQRQGIPFDTLTLVVWTSALEEEPDLLGAGCDPDDDEYFGEAEDVYDSETKYHDFLRRRIFGTQDFDITSRVMLMGVDAATTGRLSISIYEELEHSQLLEQLMKWHTETAVMRFNSKQRVNRINSFAVREIINCAYGMENGKGYLETKPEIIKENVLRLLPCITQGRAIPADLVQNLVKKASNPLAYNYKKGDKHPDNHRIVIETACGMIRKQNIDRKRGVQTMAYDPNETDRSYLFGCLLAIADAAEYASYSDEDKASRNTNAKRYWSMFAKRPFTTWAIIETQVRVYMLKLDKKLRDYFEGEFNSVMAKFNLDEFSDNSALTSAYLLGYHHYKAKNYTSHKKTEEE